MHLLHLISQAHGTAKFAYTLDSTQMCVVMLSLKAHLWRIINLETITDYADFHLLYLQ